MSENKRNRKYNRNKDPKGPIILAKNSDRDDRPAPDKPRILLKPKESSESRNNPTQISIASRSVDINSSNVESKPCRTQTIPTPTTSKESTISTTTESISKENSLPSMKTPFLIVSDHYQFQTHAQDFLIDTNTDFTVVGVIGTQGSGKSFILNLLTDDHFDDKKHLNKLIKGNGGIFQMRNQLKEPLSNMCCTEGIQMFITRNRTILLDCSPILCNPYKKEAILNELDDLKMIIFLLNVCNSLIVIEDSGFNMNLMRLLLAADSMKIDVYDCDLSERSPNILLFKNKCQNQDFLQEAKQNVNDLHRAFLQCSGLKMTHLNSNQEKKSLADGELDIFYFPWIQENEKNYYQAHSDLEILLTEFRQKLFMTSRQPFTLPNQQTTAFTEKNWYNLALSVWDTHKTSYFLRKYETLKEKEWALRV